MQNLPQALVVDLQPADDDVDVYRFQNSDQTDCRGVGNQVYLLHLYVVYRVENR